MTRFARAALFTLLLTLVAAPAARAVDMGDGSPLAQARAVPAPLSARGAVSEWTHVVQTISWLRYRPVRRVVYLLGGSASRESVVSESDWAAQLKRLSGTTVTTFVLSTGCQTFGEDRLIVNALPKSRGSVIISVGTSRFIMEHLPDVIPPHSTRRNPPETWYQHHYDAKTPLSDAAKQSLVSDWVENSYPKFQARLETKLGELEQVIEACEARKLKCALLEMPLNLAVVGDDFDEALSAYRQACLALANEHGISYIRFVSGIGLESSEFYDLQHLLKTGRAKWQARLSREVLRKHLL